MGFEAITGPNFIVSTAASGDSSNRVADTAFVQTAATAAAAVPNVAVLRDYIAGLTLSTAGSSSTFSVAAGVATDSTTAQLMILSSSINKTTGSWTVGTGNGALDTGSIAASTWYHVFVIKRTDTGVVDILISTSVSSPTLPTNYTLSRRIGSMKTDGSKNWTLFVQVGDEFLWSVATLDINNVALGTTVTAAGLNVPPGVQVIARMRGVFANATLGTRCLISSPDEASTAGGSLVSGDWTQNIIVSNQSHAFTIDVRTNTSQQVNTVASNASTALVAVTYGWIDSRGRNA